MKKTVFIVILSLVVCFFAFANACGNNGVYSVTFCDFDGTVIKKIERVTSGLVISSPKAPLHKGYEFVGWDKDFSNVQEDLTVTANYKTAENQLFFEHKEEENYIVTTLSICGKVKVCGFECLVAIEQVGISGVSVLPCTIEGVSSVDYSFQPDGRIRIFFYQDNIENIEKQIDIIRFKATKTGSIAELRYGIEVSVFVDENLEEQNYSVANTEYGV